MADANNTYGFNAAGVKRIVTAVKTVERGSLATTAADKFRLTPAQDWFWGKIVSSSFTDNRYTFTRQAVSNTSGTATDAVTFVDATGDYAQTGTATNIAEKFTNTAPHMVPEDGSQIVRIWWEYDTGSANTTRYLFDRPCLPPLAQYQSWQGTIAPGASVVTVAPDYDRAV